MTGTEGAGVGLLSGRTTGLFCKLFTIRPVGDVYIMLLLVVLGIIWVYFSQILGQS